MERERNRMLNQEGEEAAERGELKDMGKKIPIRVDKVEKHKKRIARVEKDKGGRKLRPSKRLAVIYDENFKEDNTEQEEEEKGLSLKELYLILYDVNDVFKTTWFDENGYDFLEENIVDEEYRKKLIEEQDYNDWYPLLKKTRKVMRYFQKSTYKKMQRARDESEVQYFNINWMRTRKGAYYYYNMRNEEDSEQCQRHMAKCSLGLQKTIQDLDDIAERNEREQEEIKRGRREKTSLQLYEEEIQKKIEETRRKKMKESKEGGGRIIIMTMEQKIMLVSKENQQSDPNKKKKEIGIGLDFILSHLEEPTIFPRTIMTKKLGYQRVVYSKEKALEHFIESDFIDCRINAFPPLKERATWIPDLLFIDLDLSNFKTKKSLQLELNKTLKSIKEKLANNNAHPTVLWSGNGYHIILPVYCPIELEHIQEFQEFDNPLKE